MIIGETLKLIRVNKGLSQRAFAKDILSHSYYSKVELGDSQISADFLFQLLEKVNITLSEFYFISKNYHSEEQIALVDEIKLYVNQFDIKKLKELYKSLDQEKNEHYVLITRNLIKSLSGEKIDETEMITLKTYLLGIPTWGHYEFQLFSLCTMIMPLAMLLNLSINLARNISIYEKFPGYEQDLVMIFINLLRVCLQEKELTEATYFLQMARRVNKNPSYANERLLLNFFEGLLLIESGEKEQGIAQAKEVIYILQLLDREMVSEKLTELLEECLR